MIIFRRPLADLIDRIKEVSREGIKTGSQHSQKDTIPSTPEAGAEKLMRAFDSPVLQEKEEAILGELENRGLKDKSETVKVLVRHLTWTQLYLHFEKVNSWIWGSQVSLLRNLNSKTTPVSEESLKPYI